MPCFRHEQFNPLPCGHKQVLFSGRDKKGKGSRRDGTVCHVPLPRIVRDSGCWRPASLQHRCGPEAAPRVGAIVTDKTKRNEERRE